MADFELLTLKLAQMTIESTKHHKSTKPPLLISSVSGSKLERIAQTKKLFDVGKIYFDHIKHEKSKNLIIGCDFGSGKDESRTHIFYYH